MISYLEGKIILKKEKFIVLDVNRVGYKVFVSKKTLFKLPEIDKDLNPHTITRKGSVEDRTRQRRDSSFGVGVKIFCYLNVGENNLDLYGFLDVQELEFFEILEEIRGIGPKAALEIASLGPLEKIKDKILKQDENIFSGIPGIGKKKAMAIILELTGKINLLEKSSSEKTGADEAETALIQLGFSKQQAREALRQVPPGIKGSEERIKNALKILGK